MVNKKGNALLSVLVASILVGMLITTFYMITSPKFKAQNKIMLKGTTIIDGGMVDSGGSNPGADPDIPGGNPDNPENPDNPGGNQDKPGGGSNIPSDGVEIGGNTFTSDDPVQPPVNKEGNSEIISNETKEQILNSDLDPNKPIKTEDTNLVIPNEISKDKITNKPITDKNGDINPKEVVPGFVESKDHINKDTSNKCKQAFEDSISKNMSPEDAKKYKIECEVKSDPSEGKYGSNTDRYEIVLKSKKKAGSKSEIEGEAKVTFTYIFDETNTYLKEIKYSLNIEFDQEKTKYDPTFNENKKALTEGLVDAIEVFIADYIQAFNENVKK